MVQVSDTAVFVLQDKEWMCFVLLALLLTGAVKFANFLAASSSVIKLKH